MAHGGSWLDLYLDYTSSLESPTIYHKWVGLATLGHALARRVWFPRATKFPIFGAQMMVVLVGGSGIVRKTTAMNAGLDLFQELPQGQGLFNILPSRTSAQKLVQEMTPTDENGDPCDAVAMICAPELGSFFSKESFNETLATHIIPLNDAPHGLFNYDTLGFADRTYKVKFISWEADLMNPCVGLIGCTTETGIARELPEQMLQGGFFGRVLWVWANDTDRPLNPLIDIMSENGDRHLQRTVIRGLHWATSLRGPMRLDKEATERFKAWYESPARMAELAAKDDGLQTGYWPRKDSHILRVAMMLNVAEIVGLNEKWRAYRKRNVDHLCDPHVELPSIRWRQVETAMAWLRELEPGRDLCTREMGRSKRNQLPQKILRMLERRTRDNGWAERLLIMRRMNRSIGASGEEVDRALAILREAREVSRRGKGKHTIWRRRREPGPYGIEEAPAGSPPDPNASVEDYEIIEPEDMSE
jgi:hypothetical protein